MITIAKMIMRRWTCMKSTKKNAMMIYTMTGTFPTAFFYCITLITTIGNIYMCWGDWKKPFFALTPPTLQTKLNRTAEYINKKFCVADA